MEPELLIDEIASADPGVREAALERLSSAGAEAVAPLLAVLCDEESTVEWSRPAFMLRKLGDVAFDAVMEAIATAPTDEVARRAGWAFSGLEVTDVERYLPALRHPSPKVRGNAAYVFQLKGKAARPYVPDLISLFGDPDPYVRQRAMWALSEIGPGGVAPQLKRLRRKGKTPALRRRALEALAEVAGPSALDDRDLAVLRRLIAVKLLAERPRPIALRAPWYAVPTSDQAAVLDAFGLSAPEPATIRLGESVGSTDAHSWNGGPHAACARVFVSPAYDGWTLVFGQTAEDRHRTRDDESRIAVTLERTAALSRRFGRAHWYGLSCGDDWSAWCLAEEGEIVRHVDNCEDPATWIGGPHPAEAGFSTDFTDFDGDLEHCYATDVAAAASVDPGVLGPHTIVEGHGVLALSECGLKHGHPPGLLDI